ncbi:LOW QUALITY PROTEIN: hypothetical protein O9K51_08309 [Purpureocillium lavendulum]|uniref:Uncharacterized protein n=1 Tax=Purpureocillium lavendulum TaxID=1247861 RepID=A0AB34FIH8_9HYPO|nr:LOW QUALITY PROTEIN: hypothetical protein O9K51_08309 [Purpureocillium lavendulum]
MASRATSAQLRIDCSDGTAGRAVALASLPASECSSERIVRGEDMTDAPVMESTGLAGGGGVVGRAAAAGRASPSCVAAEGRRRDSLGEDGRAGSSVHWSSAGLTGLALPLGPSPGVRCSCGLLCAGVGAVSTLCRENTDEAMLLSVMLWSRLRMGVPLRLLGVTGSGSRDRELLERSGLVTLGDRCAAAAAVAAATAGDGAAAGLCGACVMDGLRAPPPHAGVRRGSCCEDCDDGCMVGRTTAGVVGVERVVVTPRPTPPPELQTAAPLLRLGEVGLEALDVLVVLAALVLDARLVRLVAALELLDAPAQLVVVPAHLRESREPAVPPVLDPRDGSLAARRVVDLEDATDHGELLVDLVGGGAPARVRRHHLRDEVDDGPRPHRLLAVVGEHEGRRDERVGAQLLEELVDLVLAQPQLFLAARARRVGESVVKLDQAHAVQHGGDAEVDEPERVHVGELHARAVAAVELRGAPPLRAGQPVGRRLVLAADVARDAKVGEVDAVGAEEDVGGLDVEVAHVWAMARATQPMMVRRKSNGHFSKDWKCWLVEGGSMAVRSRMSRALDNVVAVAPAPAQLINVLEQGVEVADGGGPYQEAELVGARHVRGDELDDVAVVEAAHGDGLLAQVVDGEAAAADDALAGEADGAVHDLFNAAKGAEPEVLDLAEAGVEALGVGAAEEGTVAAAREIRIATCQTVDPIVPILTCRANARRCPTRL